MKLDYQTNIIQFNDKTKEEIPTELVEELRQLTKLFKRRLSSANMDYKLHRCAQTKQEVKTLSAFVSTGLNALQANAPLTKIGKALLVLRAEQTKAIGMKV